MPIHVLRYLKESVEMFADKHKGKLVDNVVDYYGKKTNCDLAVTTPDFSRGVGIKIKELGNYGT